MINIKKLDCGITLVTEKIDYVKSAAFGVWVKAGSCDETAYNNGVSHFIEHMMFKGTETRSAKELCEDMDKLGSQMNAFTGKEYTCYYVKSTSDNLYDSASIIVDMIRNSVFSAREMTRERMVIFEEMKMTHDQPDDVSHETATGVLLKNDPLGMPIIGTSSSLKRITRPVLVEYKESHYSAENLIISVAGNFDENKMEVFIEEGFSGYIRGLERTKPEPFEYQKANRVVTRDIQQSHITMVSPGIDYSDKRFYPLTMLSSIFGGSMSSRLFQNIREEKGLAYTVYSGAQSYRNAGLFEIYAGVSHDKIRQTISGIEEEIIKLKKHGITESELEMAREQTEAAYIFSQENIASHMFSNGKNLMMRGRVFSQDEIIKMIKDVTMDDINSAIDIITDLEKYSTCVVTNKKIKI